MKKSSLLIGCLLATGLTLAQAQTPHPAPAAPATATPPPLVTPSPEGAKVYFISPKDGDTIKGDVTVQFGLKGMGIAPALMYFENTGHHHMLVDMDLSEIPSLQLPLPTIEGKCLHYGKGQTETTLKLAPGKHTLQLVFANYLHTVHTPMVVSEKITITVE